MSNPWTPISDRENELTLSIAAAFAARTTGTHSPVPDTTCVSMHALAAHASKPTSDPLGTRTKNSTTRCNFPNCRDIKLHGRCAYGPPSRPNACMICGVHCDGVMVVPSGFDRPLSNVRSVGPGVSWAAAGAAATNHTSAAATIHLMTAVCS